MKPVMIPNPNQVQQPFYVFIECGEEHRFDVATKAKRIALDGVDDELFYHKHEGLFVISDTITGCRVAFANTLKQAKHNALRVLADQDSAKARKALLNRFRTLGITNPRHTEVGLIQARYKGFLLYTNSDGYIEGWKGGERVISRARTVGEFKTELRKPRKKRYNAYEDPNQMRIE